MSKIKERGPSAYNTAYDEFPEDLGFFPPYMFLWLLQIMLMIIGGAILASMISDNFFPKISWSSFVGAIIITVCLSTPNAKIAYGYIKWLIPLQGLCVFYIIASIPHFFFEYPLFAFIPIVTGVISLWITMSDQFRLFLYHRVKLGEWRRDQLEKNKVRREVIREQKAKAKGK